MLIIIILKEKVAMVMIAALWVVDGLWSRGWFLDTTFLTEVLLLIHPRWSYYTIPLPSLPPKSQGLGGPPQLNGLLLVVNIILFLERKHTLKLSRVLLNKSIFSLPEILNLASKGC